jgi:hypothetical protein
MVVAELSAIVLKERMIELHHVGVVVTILVSGSVATDDYVLWHFAGLD